MPTFCIGQQKAVCVILDFPFYRKKESKLRESRSEVVLSRVFLFLFRHLDISISIRQRVCLLFIPLFRAEFCFSQMCFFDQNTLLAAKKIRSKQRNCKSWLLQNENPTLFGYTCSEHPLIRNYFFKVWQNGYLYFGVLNGNLG